MRYVHTGLNGAAMAAGTLVKSGDRGAAVTELQTSLNRVALAHGCGVAPDCPSGGLSDQWPCTVPTSDPIYGPRTLTQVKSFQSYALQRNLDIGGSANGMVGPKTWGLIGLGLDGGIPGPRVCPSAAYGPALPPGGLPKDPAPAPAPQAAVPAVVQQPAAQAPAAVDARYGVPTESAAPSAPEYGGRPGVVRPRYSVGAGRAPLQRRQPPSNLGWWIGGGLGLLVLGIGVYAVVKSRK